MGPLPPCNNYTLDIGNAPYSAEITRIAPKLRMYSGLQPASKIEHFAAIAEAPHLRNL